MGKATGLKFLNGVNYNAGTTDLNNISNYNVNNHKYPLGLTSQPDLQHYVAFFINVRGKSKLVTSGNKDAYFTQALSYNGQNRLDPRDAGTALPYAVTAYGTLAAGAKAIDKASNKGALEAGKTFAKGSVGAVGAGLVTAGLQQTDILKPDLTYRLKDVITLHLEERPSVKYSANYQNKDLGALAGLLAGGGSATDTSKAGGVGEYLALAGSKLAKIPSIVGAAGVENLLSASAKVATNPFKEVLFESVDFRSFSFKYRFFPENEDEVRNVQNIIKTFKMHMHPELSKNKLFYIYPSEFEIRYYYKNKENNNFHKISTCALTDMQVEYGGEQFSSFRDGSPVEYTLTLTFKELETMTRQRVEEGY